MNNTQSRTLPQRYYMLLTLMCLLLSACGTPENEQQKQLNMHITQGEAYLKQSQLNAALKEANAAIKISDTVFNPYQIRVSVHQQLGQFKQAITLLEHFPGEKNNDYYFTLITLYQQSHKIASSHNTLAAQKMALSKEPLRLQLAQAKQLIAEDHLAEAQESLLQLQNNKDYAIQARLALVQSDISQKAFNNALTILAEVLELSPNNEQAYILQGKIYLYQQQYVKAERAFTLALNGLPSADLFTAQKIDLLKHLTLLLNKQGRTAEAAIYTKLLSVEFPQAESINQQYEQASKDFDDGKLIQAQSLLKALLKMAPQHEKANTLLGIIYFRQGDMENANNYLAKVVDPELSHGALNDIFALTQLKSSHSSEILAYLQQIPEQQYSANTWALYITAAITEKQYSEAKNALDNALLHYPSDTRFALLENIYLNQLDDVSDQQAIQPLNSALKLQPGNTQLQVAKIKQLLKQGRHPEIDAYITQLQAHYPNKVDTQLIIAEYLFSQHQFTQSLLHLERVKKQQGNNIFARYLLSNIHKKQGNWTKSIREYQQIIAIDPLQLSAYLGRLAMLLKLKQDPLTSTTYLPNNYHAGMLAFAQASWAVQQNKLVIAEKLISQTRDHFQGDFQQQLAKLTLQLEIKKARNTLLQNNYADAQHKIDEITMLSSDNGQIDALQAELYLAQGKTDQAITFYNKVLQRQPQDLISLNNIAWLYFKKDDERALNFAKQAYEIAPNNASIVDTYGWILAHNHQYKQGKKLIESALMLDPNNQEIRSHLTKLNAL